jgi:hypothetical protein
MPRPKRRLNRPPEKPRQPDGSQAARLREWKVAFFGGVHNNGPTRALIAHLSVY